MLRMRHQRQADLTAVADSRVIYVGLGDRFDDDRRLVLVSTVEIGPGPRSRSPWPFARQARPIAGYRRFARPCDE
jgi:hypothetical protein